MRVKDRNPVHEQKGNPEKTLSDYLESCGTARGLPWMNLGFTIVFLDLV
jgi:hypothetical protein